MNLLSRLRATGRALSDPFSRWAIVASREIDNLLSRETVTAQEVEELLSLESDPLYLTQAEWFVDADAGDDSADGSSWATALKTTGAVARRWNRPFSPTLTTISLRLRGTFSAPLVVKAVLTGAQTVLTIAGEMQQESSSTIVTYTAFNPTGGVRASIQDVGDISALVNRRVRITSGAVEGAVTFGQKAGPSADTVYIGQFFRSNTSATVSTSNPANGDAYVSETYLASVPGWDVEVIGGLSVFIRDLSVPMTEARRCAVRGPMQQNARATVIGCEFVGASTLNIMGPQTLAACRNTCPVICFGRFLMRSMGWCANAPFYVSDGCYLAGQSNSHQGPTAVFEVDTSSTAEDLAHRGFFDVNSQWCMAVVLFGKYFQINTSALIWGTNNVASSALLLGSGSIFMPQIKPTLAVTSGGNPAPDMKVAGLDRDWDDIPYIDIGAGTNNSGAMAVYRA